MLQTSARLLRLLALLQSAHEWTGPELARRLEVSPRTVRADIERLRELGYPVDGIRGRTGGYRLGSGSALPPLLLEDDEAVAVAIGLRTASSGGIEGIEESSLRALVKLEQVLPSRLRHRVSSMHGATLAIPSSGPSVSSDTLTAIARAIRQREQLRFDYNGFDGSRSRRSVEPHRLVHARGRWYLVAWDPARDDWRTFRADRLSVKIPNGPRFRPRDEPPGGLVQHVERGLGAAAWQYRASPIVHAPAATIAARVPPAVVVEPVDDTSCVAHVGADNPYVLALWLGMLGADFEVEGAPELQDALQTLAGRFARAAR
jgi:predicted DNA-binding transcriptional regulator YafY